MFKIIASEMVKYILERNFCVKIIYFLIKNWYLYLQANSYNKKFT